MASTRRKSAAIALAVIGIAGLSLAAAAQLNVDSASLGAGSTLVASCDDAVDVDYTTDVVSGKYVVTHVVVSDIASVCEDETIGITVAGVPAVGSPYEVTPTEIVVGATGTETFDIVDMPAADAANVAVIIYAANA